MQAILFSVRIALNGLKVKNSSAVSRSPRPIAFEPYFARFAAALFHASHRISALRSFLPALSITLRILARLPGYSGAHEPTGPAMPVIFPSGPSTRHRSNCNCCRQAAEVCWQPGSIRSRVEKYDDHKECNLRPFLFGRRLGDAVVRWRKWPLIGVHHRGGSAGAC